MSMPVFPECNPCITRENAIHMILTSIAMEELALSHILNAEGEKLQHVLKHLKPPNDIDKLLAVNASISNLLENVSQNQMLLKGKMDKALNALTDPCLIDPCKEKCGAVLDTKCEKWCPDTALKWNAASHYGDCVRISTEDSSKIEIRKKGRFLIGFSLTVKSMAGHKSDFAIALQTAENKTIYTFYDNLTRPDTRKTLSAGVAIDTAEHTLPFTLHLKLLCAEALMVENAAFTITEI